MFYRNKIASKKLVWLIFFTLTGMGSVSAQSLLTLENAVNKTLENQFDIKISKNRVEIQKEQTTWGNAGMLPQINLLALNTNTLQYATLQQVTGNIIDIDGAQNLNVSYGVGLEWTIFDGMRMFKRFKQLKEEEKLSETQLRFDVLNKITDVYQTYVTLSGLQWQRKALDSLIDVSKFRLKTAQNRYEIGKASKLDVLNASVDLNNDESTLALLDEQIAHAKTRLNQLMLTEWTNNFFVDIEINVDKALILPDILEKAAQLKPELQSLYIQEQIQMLNLSQIKSDRLPTIAVNSAYNLNRAQTPFGFITESRGRNFVYGITARLNIFDGNNQNRLEKVAAFEVENQKLLTAQRKREIESQLVTLYQSYQTHLTLMQREQQNEQIAKENLSITLDKYKLGAIGALDFRTAQIQYAQAVVRYVQSITTAKQTEVALKALAGILTL
jgi:outer membrane protein